MGYKITSQFERLENKKHTFLHSLFSWTPEQLRFRPVPASWSALEVVDHVLKTESGIFAEMQMNLPGAHTTTVQNRLRGFLLNTLMSSPVRLKIPAAASVVLPGNTRDLSEMAETWTKCERARRNGSQTSVQTMRELRSFAIRSAAG